MTTQKENQELEWPEATKESTTHFPQGLEEKKCEHCQSKPVTFIEYQFGGRSRRIQGAFCSDCTGFAEEHEKRKKEEREEEANQEARKIRIEDCIEMLGGIRAYEEFTLETFRRTKENSEAFDYMKGFDPKRQNVFLWGSCGTGKTHLAYALARFSFLEKRERAKVLKIPEIMRMFRKREPYEEENALRSLVSVQVLVVDELGIGKETDFARQTIQELLDRRNLKRQNGLIITSNYSLKEFSAKLGHEAIPSRIAGMCDIIHIGGQDWRIDQG